MSEEVKTFPKQDRWELETPFGTGTVSDWRGPKSDEDHVRAGLYFENLTINKKEYRGVHIYLQTMPGPRETGPRYWWNVSTGYNSLTPAAKRKLIEFLEEQHKLTEYLRPLPWEDVHELELDSLRKDLAREIAKAGEVNSSTDGLVDDVLREMLNARNEGKSYMDLWLRPERD